MVDFRRPGHIWHVAKGTVATQPASCTLYSCLTVSKIPLTGFHKKLEKLGKQKNCEMVAEWQKSIINHLYWCVLSTPANDSELI